MQGTQSQGGEKDALFTFVLPWDDASPSVANISHWLHKPAGKFGPIRIGADGHLYAGAQRVRFWGVNLCFGACFPRKEDAEKIAARMANNIKEKRNICLYTTYAKFLKGPVPA